MGGATGQVLAKIDATNYNTNWITPASGGGLTLPLTQNLTFSPDATYDIGAVASTRPRTIYAATSFLGPGSVPNGGASGAVLTKNTATSYDAAWVAPFTQAAADARYLTPATAASTYLPLAGGTLTGNLLFSADNTKDIGASAASRPRNVNVAGAVVTPVVGTPLVQSSTILQLGSSNAARWRVHTTGDLWAETDNTYDIGAAGSVRPRNLYLGGRVTVGGANEYIRNPVNALNNLSIESADNQVMISGKIAAYLGGNAYLDGTNWQRFDVAQPYSILSGNASGLYLYTGAAGANPATAYSQKFGVDTAGNTTITGNLTVQGSTAKLPAGSIQSLVGQYQATPTWSSTTATAWLATGVSANFTTSGGLLRFEFSSSFIHTAPNAYIQIGIAIDTPGSPNVYWIQTISQSGTLCTGVWYGTVTAGAHTAYVIVYNYTVGTLSQAGSTFHTLYVTEQKA